MTRKEIIDIYRYCIGGHNMPYETMKKEVEKFLDGDRGNLLDAVSELKSSEYTELELTGYYDH